MAGLVSSKSFVDYSTSGLENPLTHFLAVLLFLLPVGGGIPSRGVIEVKSTSEDAWLTADGPQVSKYWGRYNQVLVTNYRDFVLVGRDPEGRQIKLETYRLARDEAEFWADARHPAKKAAHIGESFLEFLKRAMLLSAPLDSASDLAVFLASYAHEAKFRIEHGEYPGLATVRTALETALADHRALIKRHAEIHEAGDGAGRIVGVDRRKHHSKRRLFVSRKAIRRSTPRHDASRRAPDDNCVRCLAANESPVLVCPWANRVVAHSLTSASGRDSRPVHCCSGLSWWFQSRRNRQMIWDYLALCHWLTRLNNHCARVVRDLFGRTALPSWHRGRALFRTIDGEKKVQS